jgi:hypothetical protein
MFNDNLRSLFKSSSSKKFKMSYIATGFPFHNSGGPEPEVDLLAWAVGDEFLSLSWAFHNQLRRYEFLRLYSR